MRAVVILVVLLAAAPTASPGRDGALLASAPRRVPDPPQVQPWPAIGWPPEPIDPVVGLTALAAGVPMLLVSGFVLRLAWLRALGVIADARIALAEKRAKLAAILPRRDRAVNRLSLTEVEEVLAVMPDISEASRTALLQLLQARIEER